MPHRLSGGGGVDRDQQVGDELHFDSRAKRAEIIVRAGEAFKDFFAGVAGGAPELIVGMGAGPWKTVGRIGGGRAGDDRAGAPGEHHGGAG